MGQSSRWASLKLNQLFIKLLTHGNILIRVYSVNLFLIATNSFSADSSYCWAFSISSMLRHSLNMFLRERKNKYSADEKIISEAKKYLNGPEFHKRLRNCFEAPSAQNLFSYFFVDFLSKPKKERTNNDNTSETKVCRDKCSNWTINRRLQRQDN